MASTSALDIGFGAGAAAGADVAAEGLPVTAAAAAFAVPNIAETMLPKMLMMHSSFEPRDGLISILIGLRARQ